jgi:hypothetical protein
MALPDWLLFLLAAGFTLALAIAVWRRRIQAARRKARSLEEALFNWFQKEQSGICEQPQQPSPGGNC